MDDVVRRRRRRRRRSVVKAAGMSASIVRAHVSPRARPSNSRTSRLRHSAKPGSVTQRRNVACDGDGRAVEGRSFRRLRIVAWHEFDGGYVGGVHTCSNRPHATVADARPKFVRDRRTAPVHTALSVAELQGRSARVEHARGAAADHLEHVAVPPVLQASGVHAAHVRNGEPNHLRGLRSAVCSLR